jgi:hypothetical protein
MMDAVDNERATAQELVSYAREQGVELETLRNDSVFQKDRRWIFLWRKQAGLPCSGPADEREGTLHYNMQGAIDVLPSKLEESAGSFRGTWTEAGTFDNVEQAFGFLKAWLLDRKEVDDLPGRSVRRHGI